MKVHILDEDTISKKHVRTYPCLLRHKGKEGGGEATWENSIAYAGTNGLVCILQSPNEAIIGQIFSNANCLLPYWEEYFEAVVLDNRLESGIEKPTSTERKLDPDL